jgi:hypothetical protein
MAFLPNDVRERLNTNDMEQLPLTARTRIFEILTQIPMVGEHDAEHTLGVAECAG